MRSNRRPTADCRLPIAVRRILLPAASCLLPVALVAQDPLLAERADFARWLETSPVSPYAAIYHQPLTDDLAFGPGAAPPLDALPPGTLQQGLFGLRLNTEDGRRTVPRNRDVRLGAWHVRVSGERGRSSVTVFGPPGSVSPPGWYPPNPMLVGEGVLQPPDQSETRRMLGLDGVEVEATHAGTLVATVAGLAVRLTVFRMPDPASEESELTIFFRDETNDAGTYPAGRFLPLQPLGGDRYRADFNRARNPFCAYNTVFPCPRPWRGNEIPAPIEAGERYDGGESP
jgi:hypothetical protein